MINLVDRKIKRGGGWERVWSLKKVSVFISHFVSILINQKQQR